MTLFCDLISYLKKMLEKERLQERMFLLKFSFQGTNAHVTPF